MSSSMMHTSYTEKNPLLPITSDEECQRLECQRNKSYKSKYRRQGFLFVLFLMILSLHNAYYDKIRVSIGNKNNDVAIYSDNEMTAKCQGKPDIPFTGLANFEFNSDDYPELSISQKTKAKRVSRNSISYYGGNVNVIVDESLSKVAVDFDLKFSNDELNDIFWIEQLEDREEETGHYFLTIETDEDATAEGCVTIDITVRLPHADSLKSLDISLANNAIIFDEGLKFDKLSLAIANGHVDIEKGITLAKTDFRIANGHVSGTIDTLSDELHASIANGHFAVAIKEIDQSTNDAIPIGVSIANGHVDLQVPATFESIFKLNNISGRKSVTSDAEPEKVHRRSSGWGSLQGYFGDNADTKNKIQLSAANGELKLNYV